MSKYSQETVGQFNIALKLFSMKCEIISLSLFTIMIAFSICIFQFPHIEAVYSWRWFSFCFLPGNVRVFWCRSTFSCIGFYNCVSSFCWKRTICPSMLAKVTGLVCNSLKKKKMLLRSVSRCLVWTLMGLSISLGDKLCNNLRLLFIFTQEWYSKNVKISRYPVHW